MHFSCCFNLFAYLFLSVLLIYFYLFTYLFICMQCMYCSLPTCLLVHLCPPPFLNNLKSQHFQETGKSCLLLCRPNSSASKKLPHLHGAPTTAKCEVVIERSRFLMLPAVYFVFAHGASCCSITATPVFPCPCYSLRFTVWLFLCKRIRKATDIDKSVPFLKDSV
jgi:hypothetical protein